VVRCRSRPGSIPLCRSGRRSSRSHRRISREVRSNSGSLKECSADAGARRTGRTSCPPGSRIALPQPPSSRAGRA
jgi:hypothetical protein